METVCILLGLYLVLGVKANYCVNYTGDAADRQLLDFKQRHPIPTGILTADGGEPVEIRDTIAINSDFFTNEYYLDLNTHAVRERIPERVVHAKGIVATGYFEVTNDVSKYTKAEVFNGLEKKTPVTVRLSSSRQRLGGTDLGREFKGFAIKFYTKEGNLDLLCLNSPTLFNKDPEDFPHTLRSLRRNPVTNLVDSTMQWDLSVLTPFMLLPTLWTLADFGIPKGYRYMDGFPAHTFELSNEHGESYYARFSFRNEQGAEYFTSAEAQAVASEDPDFFVRDLFNAIASKNYPSWRLEIDVLSIHDIKKVDYNPFDITELWKNGTYKTVTIGRVVLNKFGINQFKDSEQSAFAPGNLVPGIPGPVDIIFKSRRFAYRDAQNYRLGVNHNEIEVNKPKYRQTYNRDGVPPVRENMYDVPHYYPNSFNGPIAYVDENKPVNLLVLERNSIDFDQLANFYINILGNDAHRQRTADNTAASLQNVFPGTAVKVIKLLNLIDPDFGKRVTRSLLALKAQAQKQTTRERYSEIAQCLANNIKNKYQ